MFKKALTVVLCSAATVALAEPQRVLLTRENQFPALHQLEVGYEFQQREFNDLNYRTHSAQARYGLIENLTARLDVPFVMRDADFESDEEGLGDIKLGFDLLAYEDVFSYPYIIPHLDIGFATGDEDKGLGTGETSYTFGLSVGTVVYEVLHYIADVSYAVNHDALASADDDVFMASLSVMWTLSEKFALSLEGRLLDFQDTDNEPYLIGGGMAYRWTDDFQTSLFYGGWQESETGEDTLLSVKAALQF